MIDPSGEGWSKHMLSGTCQLLQLAGPQQKMSFLRKFFFELFRVLEASRAVLYGDSTILSHPDWLAFQQARASTSAGDWDSLGSILSLMIQISKFNLEYDIKSFVLALLTYFLFLDSLDMPRAWQ